MGRTACTDPQCLYSTAIPLLPLWAVQPVQTLSACTVQLYLYSTYGPYSLYRASVPVQYSYTSTPPMGRTACTEPQCLYKGALYLYHTPLLEWHSFIATQFIRSLRWLYKRVPLYMYCAAPSDVCTIYVSYVLYTYFILCIYPELGNSFVSMQYDRIVQPLPHWSTEPNFIWHGAMSWRGICSSRNLSLITTKRENS